MSNITNLNRDYLIKINVKEATIDVPKMTFWNTDKKTSNMFVQLVINMSTNELISQYVTVQNATDYKITLNVIKPKTKQYKTIEATLLNEEKALFEIDLPDEFTDQVGDYSFEFEVSSKVDSNDESITTSNGTYKVNGSILTNLNEETSSSPDLPILKQLIEQVKSLQGGDLTGYQKKSDNSLETTSKEVVGAINEVNSQYKDIADKIEQGGTGVKLSTLYWENTIKPPYWILHLDCARKYFSVDNVKLIIDMLDKNGFNQLQLHISENEGFRFALDDMIFKDEDGNSYDLSSCLGGNENPTKYWNQNEMDNIINYAQYKGIDIVPSIDMPGHMTKILSKFGKFKYNGSSNTLDFTNLEAIKFAKIIVDKYCKYFSNRGCHYYNIGYDEIINYSSGFKDVYENGIFNKCVEFANTLIDVVKKNGLIPRLFNEIVYYKRDYNYIIDKDTEVLYWHKNAENLLPYAEELQKNGYKVINSSGDYYYILRTASFTAPTVENIKKIDLLRDFRSSPSYYNGYGAMFCIWCDNASNHSSAGDNGDFIVSSISPLIDAFGENISNVSNYAMNNKQRYTITNNLSNCTNSNTLYTIVDKGKYISTITPDIGYILDTVTVTMGGIDVTSTVYNEGVITINNVTGDIIITAIAKLLITFKFNNADLTCECDDNKKIALSNNVITIQDNNDYKLTDYISVEGGKTLVFNKARWDIFSAFDSDKNFIQHFSISKESTSSEEFVLPSNASYIRINIYKTGIGTIEIAYKE